MPTSTSPAVLVVASKNPVKLQAAKIGFGRLFPDRSCMVRGVSVPSGVADQPMSDQETRAGAETRARGACEHVPDADFWLGIEGGIADDGATMTAFAWIAVLGPHGRGSTSRSAAFTLPPQVADLVRAGEELGAADDNVFGAHDSKREGGAVGLLTQGAIDRTELYAHAICLSFIPFKNPDLY